MDKWRTSVKWLFEKLFTIDSSAFGAPDISLMQLCRNNLLFDYGEEFSLSLSCFEQPVSVSICS